MNNKHNDKTSEAEKTSDLKKQNLVQFDKQGSIDLCNEICEQYFNKNFGKLSKADFELILFKHYIEFCYKNKISTDDYEISKRLGILQSRVRSLKQQKYKKYDSLDENWWKDELNNSMGNVFYVKETNSIKFLVKDVNVKEEVIHYIEQKGWFDDTSFNKKLITIPLKCYWEIFSTDDCLKDTFTDKEKAKIERMCEKSDLTDNDKKEVDNFLKNFTQDGLNSLLKSGTKELLLFVLNSLPFGGILSTAAKVLINVIKNAD